MPFASFHLSSVVCESSEGKKPFSCPQGVHDHLGNPFVRETHDVKVRLISALLSCGPEQGRGAAGLQGCGTWRLS